MFYDPCADPVSPKDSELRCKIRRLPPNMASLNHIWIGLRRVPVKPTLVF